MWPERNREISRREQGTRTELTRLLEQAITAITTCHTVYAKENIRPCIRRMLNQGIFFKV